MRVLARNGMEIASVALEAKKGEPMAAHARIPAANIALDAQIALERVGEDLVAHVTVPGMAALDMVVTLDDIAGAKGAMNADVFKFALKAMMK